MTRSCDSRGNSPPSRTPTRHLSASARSRSNSISAGTCCTNGGPANRRARIPMTRRSARPASSSATCSRASRRPSLAGRFVTSWAWAVRALTASHPVGGLARP